MLNYQRVFSQQERMAKEQVISLDVVRWSYSVICFPIYIYIITYIHAAYATWWKYDSDILDGVACGNPDIRYWCVPEASYVLLANTCHQPEFELRQMQVSNPSMLQNPKADVAVGISIHI
jgi:hypothetical protein